MPPPIPRCSSWPYSSLNSSSCFSLPRYGSRIGLHIFLFEACSTFTRVAACPLALPPIRDTLIEGFSHFVTSMTAPIASGWSGCRVGFAPTGKRRLCTAHATNGHPHIQSRPANGSAGPLAHDRKDADLGIHFHLDAIGYSCGDIFSKSREYRYIAQCGALRKNGVH